VCDPGEVVDVYVQILNFELKFMMCEHEILSRLLLEGIEEEEDVDVLIEQLLVEPENANARLCDLQRGQKKDFSQH